MESRVVGASCGGGGGGGRGSSSGGGLSLLDHILLVDPYGGSSSPRLTLDDILRTEKRSPPPPPMNRTLLDIIRDEERHGSLFGHKDKKSWKAFRDRLRLKRAGEAWSSSIHVPTSDIPIQNNSSSSNNNHSRSLMARRSSVRFANVPIGESDEQSDSSSGPASRLNRRASTRMDNIPSELDELSVNRPSVEEGPSMRSYMPQFSRHNSTRRSVDQATTSTEDDDPDMGYRTMSARQAVAAQEASEAAAQAEAVAAAAAAAAAAAEAAAAAAEEEDDEGEEVGEGNEEEPPVRMSLMDLLEETDRQMGVVGSRYRMEDEDDDDEGGGEEDYGVVEERGGVEVTCCVCMVRHKGSAFIPCGHTFCRLCSRELLVQRGNCPLCNGYILEILDIF